eukprot:1518848-Rhodomonas_salina.1
MGLQQKGKDSALKSNAAAVSQSKVSSFFSRATAPIFDKPQERKKGADGGTGVSESAGGSA